MQQINVDPEKANALLALAKLSAKSLNKLASRLKDADAKRLVQIEKKIDTYSSFI